MLGNGGEGETKQVEIPASIMPGASVGVKTKAAQAAQKKENMKPKKQVEHPYVIGRSCLIRTITNYYTGRLVAVYDR